jgi:transcriptional regulator with XRE-family HTH domain
VEAWAILRDARARSGLSQRALAQRAGTSQSLVARIERGRVDPSVGTLARLIAACGLDARVRLEPHDDHDEVLRAQLRRLTPEQRVQRNVDEVNAIRGLREAVRASS